jgi:hypothetical protein
MLVFLSWSGERSRDVAKIFEQWLGQVIQAVEPWVSIDIDKGARWGSEIADKLEQSPIGIICLTRDNLDSRWLLFEAGALSKMRNAYVCTFLLDIAPSEVEFPLAQFQHTTLDKGDIERLLKTINTAVAKQGGRALAEPILSKIFDTFWEKLHDDLAAIATQHKKAARARTQADILDEILTTTRNLSQRLAILERLAEKQARPGTIDSIPGASLASVLRGGMLAGGGASIDIHDLVPPPPDMPEILNVTSPKRHV